MRTRVNFGDMVCGYSKLMQGNRSFFTDDSGTSTLFQERYVLKYHRSLTSEQELICPFLNVYSTEGRTDQVLTRSLICVVVLLRSFQMTVDWYCTVCIMMLQQHKAKQSKANQENRSFGQNPPTPIWFTAFIFWGRFPTRNRTSTCQSLPKTNQECLRQLPLRHLRSGRGRRG